MRLTTKTVHVTCRACGHRMLYQRPLPACERCGNDWLDGSYDLERLRGGGLEALIAARPFTMWRYWELLPLRNPANIVTLGEGGTALVRAQNLGLMLSRPNLFIKDERQGPTGSFKDRQASLAISAMKEAGITECVVASTGNVAISYSAYCARAGIKLWAFFTSLVPAGKMHEVALYGSEVVKITGTYDQSKAIAAQFAKQKGLFLDRGIRSIAAKESMKTLAYEVCEQFAELLSNGELAGREAPSAPFGDADRMQTPGNARWVAPDWYIQAVSGGLGPLGAARGFAELYALGLIDRMPKIACIQADGCAPMAQAFRAGLDVAEPVAHPRTHIATLATGDPGKAYGVLREYMLEHGGTMEAVSDEEAFRAMHVLAKMDGVSVEPAAGVAFAGLFKLVRSGLIAPNDVVVVNCSGHTFPVEKELLGDEWARSFGMAQEQVEVGRGEPLEVGARAAAVAGRPEEGLLAALEHLDTRVHSVAIVDDTPEAARLIRRIIQARGDYQVYEAHSGKEGLALIREKLPDMVVLDLMMPEMDGFAVIEALKSEEATRQIPVIVVTAKELTIQERQRLTGQVQSLWQKGTFMDDDLVDDIERSLK
jgi:threonine synthase